jgi:hypothetical protein
LGLAHRVGKRSARPILGNKIDCMRAVMQEEHLTVDQCDELAKALREDACSLTAGIGEGEPVVAGEGLPRACRHEKNGSSQSELTVSNAPMMSVVVLVFGRRHDETLGRLSWPASKKRQGTKSREVGHRWCNGRYGDLAAVRDLSAG